MGGILWGNTSGSRRACSLVAHTSDCRAAVARHSHQWGVDVPKPQVTPTLVWPSFTDISFHFHFFLITNEFEHLFICRMACCISSWVNCLSYSARLSIVIAIFFLMFLHTLMLLAVPLGSGEFVSPGRGVLWEGSTGGSWDPLMWVLEDRVVKAGFLEKVC